MQEKIVKNNENLFTRKCYELSYDMFLQIEKYDDKVNYIIRNFLRIFDKRDVFSRALPKMPEKLRLI